MSPQIAKTLSSLLAFLLIACGGGGGAPTTASAVVSTLPAVTAAPTAAVSFKKLSIEMYGDSSLDGFNVNPSDMGKESPCQLMQSAVNGKYGAGEISVNCQTPASDSSNLVSGQYYDKGPWPQILTYDRSLKTYTKPVPDLVLINHNLNDIRNQRSTTEYESNLKFLVSQGLAQGVKVIVLENSVPLTTQLPYGATQAVLDTQPAFLKLSKDVAAQLSVPYVDTYATVKAIPSWETYITDSIHPNAALYKIISDNRFNTIVPLLDKLRQP
jgi:lysophospholipase L1-like esterase